MRNIDRDLEKENYDLHLRKSISDNIDPTKNNQRGNFRLQSVKFNDVFNDSKSNSYKDNKDYENFNLNN